MRYGYFLLLFFFLDAAAQEKTFSPKVQPLFDYELSLRTYYRKLLDAERQEFKDLTTKPIMSYLPDVGLQFGLPSIHVRLSDYTKYKHDNLVLDRKLLSINQRLELELNAAIQNLRIEYKKLALEHDRLQVATEKMTYVEHIYEIARECCQKRHCTPEECSLKDLAHFEQKQALRELQINFDILILEFEKIAKHKLPELRYD